VAGFEPLRETIVYEGFRIRVARAVFRAPDGSEMERDVVHHPGAVAVVPLHDDGTVTLVQQFRAALGHELIELPAGIRDVAGEADVVTANRELVEEVGLEADHLEHLVTFHNSPGFCDESLAIFLGTGLRAVAHSRQGPEEQEMLVLRVPLDDALAMVDSGRITDAKTIIGLLETARRRR
jgi:ADP-ribose pyrophosphatase